MSPSDVAAIGSLVSGFAVLVSLIYLSLQVKQAERNQQASIRAARATRIVDLMLACTDPAVADAVLKGQQGSDEMSGTQLFQFTNYATARFFNAEDAFYQHREGLLNAFTFDAVSNGLRISLTSAAMRVIYKRQRVMMGREFVEFVDQLLATTAITPNVDQSAQFKADIAAELAQASA